MIIGVPKEIKTDEYRVGLTPFSVHELVLNGHEVIVEHNAGYGINFLDEHYIEAGAKIAANAAEFIMPSVLDDWLHKIFQIIYIPKKY